MLVMLSKPFKTINMAAPTIQSIVPVSVSAPAPVSIPKIPGLWEVIMEGMVTYLELEESQLSPVVEALEAAVSMKMQLYLRQRSAAAAISGVSKVGVTVKAKGASPKRVANGYSLMMRVVGIAKGSAAKPGHEDVRAYLGSRMVVPRNNFKDQAAASAKKYAANFVNLDGVEMSLGELIQRISSQESGAAAAGVLWGVLDEATRKEAAEMVRDVSM